MSLSVVLQFLLATVLPAVTTGLFWQLDSSLRLSEKNHQLWQLAVGLAFGLVAVFGTEFGIDTHGATMNVRDAAPLTAGLLFGAPAGVIAGIIGGVERWFAALWGRGMYTRLACSIATCFAGFYAAIIRFTMLEDRKPTLLMGILMGFVSEVLHLLLVFLTHPNDTQNAFRVVQVCALPMVLCNGLAVGLAVYVVMLLNKERMYRPDEQVEVTELIQQDMLVSVTIAFLMTTALSAGLHARMADATTQIYLQQALSDVQDDITDESQLRLEELARQAVELLTRTEGEDVTVEELQTVRDFLGVSEVALADERGDIVLTTNEGSSDLDVGGAQYEFMMLLGDDTSSPSQKQKDKDSGWYAFTSMPIEGGSLRIGYDEETFHDILRSDVIRATKNRHVGQDGFVVTMDEDGDVLLDAEQESVLSEEYRAYRDSFSSIHRDADAYAPGQIFTLELADRSFYVMKGEVAGYKIAALYPADEADQARDVSVLIGSFTEILVFALLFASIYFLVKGRVVNGIRSVNECLDQITDGNLNVVVDVRSSKEMASLSDDINQTVDALTGLIAKEAARLDQELEYARSIQASILPSVFPAFPTHDEFDIHASMTAARLVGGDFYDLYLLDENRVAFLVADVSGKSVPAAMFMMRAKTVMRSYADQGFPVCDIFYHTNNTLCESNDTNMFVTAWMGVMDVRTGHVSCCNAGHNPPLVRRGATGSYEVLELRHGLILGCMEGVSYHIEEFDLNPGDALFLYTDGVVEANDVNHRQFGIERLRLTLNQLGDVSSKETCDGVHAAVDAFAGEEPQFDDITMITLRYFGTSQWSEAMAGETLSVEAVTSNIDVVTDFVDARLQALGCPLTVQYQIDVALDELFSNICNYGYGEFASGPAWVGFEELEEGRVVRITLVDEGVPFNPLTIPDPDTHARLEKRRIGGLGIFIVRRTMDAVTYRRDGNRNVVTITKRLR